MFIFLVVDLTLSMAALIGLIMPIVIYETAMVFQGKDGLLDG